MLTARIIEDNGGQILILPEEIRIEAEVVIVEKRGRSVILMPVTGEDTRPAPCLRIHSQAP